MFDYHIHSNFSADCETSMENTIEQAIKLGLKEVCFTEHIDYDYPDTTIHFEFDLDQYDRKLKEMQAAYAGRLRIKKGIEIGVQPHLLHRYETLMRERAFDFVICSMHTAEGKDLHSGSFLKNYTVNEAHQAYYEELLDCVKNYKNFDVLGHVDLIKRYTKEKSSNNFHDILAAIFKEIIPEGKGIELNTSGIRYGLEGGMPSVDILHLYKECGGEIVTLGSDSHIETTVAYQFKESLEMLEAIGFKYVATFANRKPTFHSIANLISSFT
ncbi:histidinol-phosphatase HisJ family protein [Virgibacillus sp. NKC19-3]|uniref:histidinol-phosphatase HisJ family protein n=1 Tax=Virgibacillus saliphilus TaxID=2831674 RepID=UPI001C9A7929|nr:histidinol-phosphatase HisJ family protein [Virgibacillus sp. NKC19-3]MBY7142245.1 histidinol-phosphatase HisJ family protein [Virgibacillus sp. NKC19-3]